MTASMSPEELPQASVVAAVLAGDPTSISTTIDAIRRQVYGPARILVVGGDRAGRRVAEGEHVEWTPTIGSVIDASGLDVSHLWIVRAGVVPRPDALLSLVREAERVGAGVAGSKVLDRQRPQHLLSVGLATDVFDVPFTGLDADERDQGQYDVVRDVAAVSGSSMLLRRDLATGLGGPDRSMAPTAAAVDLCQRARLRGARVVIVPSSEVLAPDVPTAGWREEASRLRAVSKVYGPATLAWVLPLALLGAIVESVLAPLAGRWTLWGHVKAWSWYLAHLPSTAAARRQARRGRLADDAELFRFQVTGPLGLKAIVSDVVALARRRMPGEERLSVEAIGRELRRPAVVTALLAVAFVLLATRAIWSEGLPAVGRSLPFPDPGGALRAYAGGWNPAGLGSVDPLPPLIGAIGVVERLVFGSRRLVEYVFVFVAYGFGLLGMARLLRTWSIRTVAAVLGGVVYVAGPLAQGVAATTSLGALFAIGILPWVLRTAWLRWPNATAGRVGRVATVAMLVGLVGVLEPLALAAPAVMVLAALVFLPFRATLRALALVVVGSVGGVLMLFPWLGRVDLGHYLTDGSFFWSTSPVVLVAAGVLVLAAVVGLPSSLAGVSGWGAVLAAASLAGARAVDLDVGLVVVAVALAVGSLGLGALIGAAVEGLLRVDEVVGWRRGVLALGLVGVTMLVAASMAPLLAGRAGLPGDRLHAALDFTVARPGDPTASRVLLVGDPAVIPGDSRPFRGSAYRVVSAPMPALWELDLGDPHSGDAALEDALSAIVDQDVLRGGEVLAQFGIRWIVVLAERGDTAQTEPWKTVLGRQLDLVPLGGGLRDATFANEAEAFRAVGSDGAPWSWKAGRYEGASIAGGRVVVAENPDPRWGPSPWKQVDWRNEVAADTGTVSFGVLPERRVQAWVAFGWFVFLAAVAFWGRRSA